MAKINSITPLVGSGLTSDTASQIFDQMAQFAGYGFNRSHAAAYASLGFQTAYLKTHYPECYFAASMNMAMDEVEGIAKYASQLKQRGITLWAPNVNYSADQFRPKKLPRKLKGRDVAISYSLAAISGVGSQAATAIVAEVRKNGIFKNVRDFTNRMGSAVNKKAATSLAYAGAFDSISLNRATALAELTANRNTSGTQQLSMFDIAPEIIEEIKLPEFDLDERLDHEFDVLGHYHSAHPLSSSMTEFRFGSAVIRSGAKQPRMVTIAAILTSIEMKQTKDGDPMAVLTLSDPDGCFEVVAIGSSWQAIRYIAKKKARLALKCIAVSDGVGHRLIVEGGHNLALKIEEEIM